MEEEPMNIQSIPPELMLEIFSRLPVRSLFQIRSVCKQWHDMAKDPRLPSMHLAQASTNEGEETLILTYGFDAKEETDLKLIPTEHCTPPKVLSHLSRWCCLHDSVDGLLCIAEYAMMRVLVSNPLTGKYLTLPLPTAIAGPIPGPIPGLSRIPRFGFGFDSSISKYKIVCTYFQEIEYSRRNLVAQVYTIGAPGSVSWREIVSQPPGLIKGDKHSVYASGVRHWLIDDHYSPNHLRSMMVISFDFEKEEFKTIPRQEFFSSSCDLVDLSGYLGVIELSRFDCVEIWKLKDYGKNEWVMEYRFEMEMLPPISRCYSIDVVGLMGQDEVVFSKIYEHCAKTSKKKRCKPASWRLEAAVVAYNLKTNAWRDIYTFTNLEDRAGEGQVCLHRGSLVSLSL